MSKHVTKAERIELELKDVLEDIIFLEYHILDDGIIMFSNVTFWYTQKYSRKDWQYRALVDRRKFLSTCTTILADKTLYFTNSIYSIKQDQLSAHIYHRGNKNGNIKLYRLD